MSDVFAALVAEGKRWAAMRDALATMAAEELLRTRDAVAQAIAEQLTPLQDAQNELAATANAIRDAAAQLSGQLDELEAEALALAEELTDTSAEAAQLITEARGRGEGTAAIVARAICGDSDALAVVRHHASEGDALAVRVLRVRHRLGTARKRIRRLSRKVARLLAVEVIREVTTALRHEHFPKTQPNAPPARATVRGSKARGPVQLLSTFPARKDGNT